MRRQVELAYRLLTVFGPRRGSFPDTDGGDLHIGSHGVFWIRIGDKLSQGGFGVVVDRSRHHLGGRVFTLEADNPIAVGLFEKIKFWVLGVHAQCMVIGFQEISDHPANQLEIEYHLAIVQGVRFKDELDLAGVSVWEPAFIWVLGEEVAVLDLDHFANSV